MIQGKFLIFESQNRVYAIELHRALEVRVAEDIVPMPMGGEDILGVYNLRGKIIKVKDLGLVLHDQKTELQERNVLIYLESRQMNTSVLVDSLIGICSSEDVEWSTFESTSLRDRVLDCFSWDQKLVLVLNSDKLVA